MHEFRAIHPASQAQIEEIERIGVFISADGLNFCGSWLRDAHPIVVPVESSDHFTKEAAQRIAAALKRTQCYCLVTDPIENFPKVFRFDPSVEAICELDRVMFPFQFVLFSENRSKVILCSKLSYYLVAGDEKFINKAIGASVLDCQIRFWEFALGWRGTPLGEHLKRIAVQYLPLSITNLSLERQSELGQ